MSRCVVFGAGGFIGKNLITQLMQDEDLSVVAFDRFTNESASSDTFFAKHPQVQLVSGDFYNPDDINSVIEENDYVFHLISSTTPATAALDVFRDIDTNIRASVQLFDICQKKRIKKVVFLSSGGTVYGDTDSLTINEETITKPISPYGIGKITIEHYLRYFKATRNLNYVIYRVANPYGPHQNLRSPQGVIPIFINRILASESLEVYGNGDMLRDYIYVSDAAKMICDSFQKENKHEVYNIGSGKGRSIIEIIDSIQGLTSLKPQILYKEKPASFVDSVVLDIGRYESEFGKFKFIDFREGLQKTIDYVKASI